MGMDVIGMNPTAAEGEYFRRNIWSWHTLAAFCCYVAPEETEPCTLWNTNDGDGLNAVQSVKLAERLERALTEGAVDNCLEEVRSHRDYDDICRALKPERIAEFIEFLRKCGGFRIW